jgi:hypothetical protein
MMVPLKKTSNKVNKVSVYKTLNIYLYIHILYIQTQIVINIHGKSSLTGKPNVRHGQHNKAAGQNFPLVITMQKDTFPPKPFSISTQAFTQRSSSL